MWKYKPGIVPLLSGMTSKQSKWDWDRKCQKVFDTIMKSVARQTLLSYPNFSKLFDIHTYASKLQLGTVISQKGKPITLYSRKLIVHR